MLTRWLLIGCALGALACDDEALDAQDRGPDPSPDAGPSPDASPDMPPPKLGPGEACAAGDCARGACVNGVCGSLCLDDDDCPAASPVCVGRAGAGRCSVPCRSSEGCAEGLVCAVTGVDAGICVAPGPGATGDACATREDCASWFCADGACRRDCTGDPSRCEADSRCLPLHTQAVCVPTGPEPPEGPCAADADCQSGVCRGGRCADVCPAGTCADDRVCVRYSSTNLCERRCADSADCGHTGRCLLVGDRRLCVTRGPGAPGAPCRSHPECESGRCEQGQCAAPCPDGECPAGSACVTDITGPTCRASGPAPLGARCEQPRLCDSGLCGAGACTVDCAETGRCPEGTRCTAFANGTFCFPTCAVDADCPGLAFCDGRFAEGPTCFWRGGAEPGAPCEDHRECASGRCGNGRCLQACAGDCPAGQRCIGFDTGDFCAATPLPEGAACDANDGCAEGLLCVGGRCGPPCSDGACAPGAVCVEGACHPGCGSNSACRPGRFCDRSLPAPACRATGAGRVDAPCAASTECQSGLCHGGACRAACGACADDETCLDLGGGDRWCVPQGAAEGGARCVAHGDCASGLCLGRRCASPCGGDAPCPADTACRAALGGAWCLGACTLDDGCDEDEACAVTPGAAEGRCVAAPPGPVLNAPCEQSDECPAPSVGCFDSPDGRRCRAPCLMGADGCPEALACAPVRLDAPAGICRAAGDGGPLAPCEAGADCASGWCIAGYLGGRCGVPCADDADCPDGRCVDLARDPASPFPVCAPDCADDAGCEAPLRCRRDLDGRGACY